MLTRADLSLFKFGVSGHIMVVVIMCLCFSFCIDSNFHTIWHEILYPTDTWKYIRYLIQKKEIYLKIRNKKFKTCSVFDLNKNIQWKNIYHPASNLHYNNSIFFRKSLTFFVNLSKNPENVFEWISCWNLNTKHSWGKQLSSKAYKIFMRW